LTTSTIPNFDCDDLRLREVIAIAETREGGEEIDLTGLWGEIYLDLGELDIESGIADVETVPSLLVGEDGYTFYRENYTFYHIAIIGPGAGYLTINAQGDSRVFHIEPGSVSIGGMTITGGNTTGNGGGILAEGDLTLSSVVVDSNQAANGGGIYAGRWVDSGFGLQFEEVSLKIFDSTVSNNSANQYGGILYGDASRVVNSVVYYTPFRCDKRQFSSLILLLRHCNKRRIGSTGAGFFCDWLPRNAACSKCNLTPSASMISLDPSYP
jgi:predicted outer membrane repeat protein